jgi:tetratricopeptide (TPR) repeat protein
MRFIFILFIFLSLFSCKSPNESQPQLGVVRIEVTGRTEAKPLFEKGLLLLHSFEYEDAREAFQEARKLDPQMPMAYWGEAMSYNHSLWSEQDFEEATAVLNALEEFDYANICSALELDLIKAVQKLYQAKMDKSERDIAYAAYMEELDKKYPDNQEVAAFYALSLLGSVPDGRDDELYGKGAVIAQGILKENPKHPGALHYLIHSYDDPNHASMALEAARAYSKVAPDASHALHMPSHIFVAMGMWDDVIASNIDSYEASITRMKEKELDNDARGYHAFHWLEYGYLQKANKEEAKKMVLTMQQYASETPSKRARVHMVFLKGTYLAETNEWESDIADIPVDVSDLNVSIQSQYHFLEGMKAYSKGNLQQLDSIIEITTNTYNKGTFIVTNNGPKMCASANRGDVTASDLDYILARKNQLEALSAELRGDAVKAEEHLVKSIEIAESISYSFGPPFIQKPPRELYADWLLMEKRNEEAKEQYLLALKTGPNRRLVMEGIAKIETSIQ